MPAIKEFYLDPRNGQANFEYDDGTTAVASLDQALLSGGGRVSGGPIVLLGDSITDMCGGLRTSGVSTAFPANGYWAWCQSILGPRFATVINAGISGNWLTQMDDRFSTDVTPYAPRIVHLFGGTNDALNATDLTLETIVANAIGAITSILAKTRQLGATLVIGTIGPMATGAAPTTAKLAARDRINQFIRKLTASSAGVILADYALSLQDPTTQGSPVGQSDGGPVVIYDNTVHPSAAGAYLIGKTLAAALDEVTAPARVFPHGLDISQYTTNPTFAGAVGATPPTGWTVSSLTSPATTWTYAYQDRTDNIAGKALKLTVAGGDANGQSILMQASRTVAMAVGDKFRAAVELECEFVSAYQSVVGLSLRAMNGSFSEIARTDVMRDSSFNTGGTTRVVDSKLKLPEKIVLLTPELTIPAGTASWLCDLNLKGGYNFTLKSFSVFKVD